ncbi:MAG: S8 family serine peptidase [Thermofilaceae archaeon]
MRVLPGLVFLVPDGRVHALGTEEGNSWGVVRVGALQAQAAGYTGSGIRIAVVDSGVDYTHPELAHAYRGGYDFVNKDSDPMDDNGHGTHVAGVIFALPNAAGVVGIAPQAELYALKVLDQSGAGYWSDVIAAIEWAIDHGMHVVNLSLGGDGNDAVAAICQLAYDRGLLLVAAAGNGGLSSVIAPACYPSVIAVGATDQADKVAAFSPTAPEVELVAPGASIYSTLPGGSFGYKSGTSMACPHVAGAAALLWSVNPGLSNRDVRAKLAQNALDLGTPGRDNSYGYGLVYLPRAVGLETPLSVEIQPTSAELTPTQPTVTLTAQVGGGQAPYTYEWYKDGNRLSGATGSTYTASQGGKYQVRVTDRLGASVVSAPATVTQTAAKTVPTLLLAQLDLSPSVTRTSLSVSAKIRVVDATGKPVPRATVVVRWTYNGASRTAQASTNSQGYVTFRSPTVRRGKDPVTFQLCVLDIRKAGWQYDPSANTVEPCQTRVLP